MRSWKEYLKYLVIDSAKQNASIAQNNEETYWQRSLRFLIIGIIGILANGFLIIILGTSVKIRQKLVNTLIIHQSFVDFLASVALVATAHLSPYNPHGLVGVHADVYCYFVMSKCSSMPLGARRAYYDKGCTFLSVA